MEYINKLEKIVLGWARNVPHLPASARKWLGENIWWIVLVGVILTAISLLIAIGGLFTLVSLEGSVSNTYYVTGTYTGLEIVNTVVTLGFSAIIGLLLAFAISPLKEMKKKGWVLLFTTLLVEALSVFVHAVLTLSVIGFIIGILFGAIALAIGAYFIAEIHGEFGHPAKKA